MGNFLFRGRSPFFKNVFVLLFGAGLAQLVNLILTTVLTRIYRPEQFGLLALFLTVSSFLTVVATGKYELAILLPKQELKAQKLVILSLTLCIVFCFVASIFFLMFSKQAAGWFHQQAIEPCLVAVPLSVLFIGAGQIFNMWSVRKERFRLISLARIGEAVITGLFSIVLKFLGTAGLIAGSLFGSLFSFLALAFPFVKQKKNEQGEHVSLKETAKAYSIFPKVNIIQSLVDLFQFSGITLFCSLFFSANIVGYYALCMRILQVPMGLIIKPLAQVFFSEASKTLHQGGDLHQLTRKTAIRTAFIALPVPLIILFAGPFLFSFIFGTHWEESGWYARIFVLWFYVDFIRSPISQIAILLRKQSQMLIISLIGNLLLIVSMFLIAKLATDIKTGFMVISAVQIVYTVGIIRWLISLSAVKKESA